MDPRSPVDRRAFVCGATVGVAGLALGRPLSAEQRRVIEDAIPRMKEATTKKALGISHWIGDESWQDSLLRLASHSCAASATSR